METETEIKVDAEAYPIRIAQWVGAIALEVAATLVLIWLRANSTLAGMVFLVLVVWLATQTGRWLALSIAGLCAVSFDYFFLPPYHTLLLAGPQEWVGMFSFAASCVVVSRVAQRARLQTKRAEQRQARSEEHTSELQSPA